MFNLIGFVMAHTGNDAYDHMPTTYDLVLGLLMIIGLALLVTWVIRKRRKRN